MRVGELLLQMLTGAQADDTPAKLLFFPVLLLIAFPVFLLTVFLHLQHYYLASTIQTVWVLLRLLPKLVSNI